MADHRTPVVPKESGEAIDDGPKQSSVVLASPQMPESPAGDQSCPPGTNSTARIPGLDLVPIANGEDNQEIPSKGTSTLLKNGTKVRPSKSMPQKRGRHISPRDTSLASIPPRSSRDESAGSSTDSVARSTLEMSGVAITELVKLVGNLEDRIESLENPKSGSYGIRVEDDEIGGDGDHGEDMTNFQTCGMPRSRTFELTTKFYYGSNAEHRRASPYPFIRARCRKLGSTVDGEEATSAPDSDDIVEIGLESPILRRYFDELSESIVHGRVPSTENLESDTRQAVIAIWFCKPFRWLIQHRGAMEDQVKALEETRAAGQITPKSTEFGITEDHTSDTQNVSRAGTAGNINISSETLTPEHDLHAQLRHLLAFIARHLKDQLQLYEDAQSGKLESVQFRDLWMLFKPGGLIYTPHRKRNNERLPRSPDSPHHRILPSLPNGKQSSASRSKGGNGPSIEQLIRPPPMCEWMEPYTPQAYRIISVVGGIPKLTRNGALSKKSDVYTPLLVLCCYMSFTGTEYIGVCDVFPFAPFDGERGITSLATYPLKYARDYRASQAPDGGPSAPAEATMINLLSNRGRSFIEASETSHRLYEGLTLGRDQEEIVTPVIIDMQLAYRHSSENVPRGSLPSSDFFAYDGAEVCSAPEVHLGLNYHVQKDWYWDHQLRLIDKARADMVNALECYPTVSSATPSAVRDVKHAMEENGHILLLPGTVRAFALRLRKWVSLDLSLMKPVVNQADWDDLILPSGHKNMVRAVVENHASGSRSTSAHVKHAADIDIVHGKGKGCIILLHGEPGVGKTSTAGKTVFIGTSTEASTDTVDSECVAAFTKRPLFPITCGDIGYDPEDVQDSLDRLLGLAQTWGCVVLLDEADVFLAKRSRDDVKRNGLVSVFLRILEYYQGILFLTTNRVGSIDDAFRSRLHLTLYYPKLGPKQTLAIWNVNLRRLDDLNRKRLEYGQEPIEVQKGRILRYAKKKWKRLGWNGRQIRNAFQTAVALAEFEANKASRHDHHDGDEGRQAPAPVRPVMTKKHFKTVAKASVQFDEYLFHTHGGSDLATNARKEQIRWDYELRENGKDQQRHHHHHQRLGGDHGLSSDASLPDSSSSSDSGSDDDSGLSPSADSTVSDDGNSGGSSDSSSEDKKKKRKNKISNSRTSKEKGKSKRGNQGKKHKSRK